MNRLPVTAVVVRWKGGDEVHRCVASLTQAREVVVVDNGSGDDGAEGLARAFPEVAVESLSENRGFAGGVNHGVEVSSEPLILLMNPDAALVEGALPVLVRQLEDDPHLAGVAPALIDGAGGWNHRWQCRKLPRWVDLGLGRSGRPMFERAPGVPSIVTQPAAAAWLVHREVFTSLGGLDTAFHPAWWEDVDFCARLGSAAAGPRLWEVVPAARAVHRGGSSVDNLGAVGFCESFHRNLARYVMRHHPRRRGRIRSMLWVSLRVRSLVRPDRRNAYRAAWSAIQKVIV